MGRHNWRPQSRDWTSPFDVRLGHEPKQPSPLSIWIGDIENGYGEGYPFALLTWAHVALVAAAVGWIATALDDRWILALYLSVAIAGLVTLIVAMKRFRLWQQKKDKALMDEQPDALVYVDWRGKLKERA
jgi:hypothetical protein